VEFPRAQKHIAKYQVIRSTKLEKIYKGENTEKTKEVETTNNPNQTHKK
jgi:hypothetical protein